MTGDRGVATKATAKSIAEDATALLDDVRSGRIHECQAIADLGGARRGNARRDYNKLLSDLDYGLDPITQSVEIHDPQRLERFALELPMFAPHEIVGALYRSGWQMFSEVFFGGIAEGNTEIWGSSLNT